MWLESGSISERLSSSHEYVCLAYERRCNVKDFVRSAETKAVERSTVEEREMKEKNHGHEGDGFFFFPACERINNRTRWTIGKEADSRLHV